MKDIYIIGLGLIGGSFARDLREQEPAATIYGIDASESHVTEALSLGFIDKSAVLEDIKAADLVVLAIPVDVAIHVLPDVLNHIGDDTIVVDMGSTKQAICEVVSSHPRRRNFLACHPIAGTEFSGPSAAITGLYNGKTNIICEVEKTAFKLQEKVLDLFKNMGMRIRYMDPVSHDKHIAYVSHLSHISAFMLGKTVIQKEKNERDIFDMAGSGFASTVRLAKSNPVTWTSIFKENKENVLETLTEYIANLNDFKTLLENDDFQGVHDEMENTNHIKEILNGIK
ncbi:prephenate dehydrogenase [Dokdonia sp. Dokd-P16]|uniref:prephenate dehydrogenase n=1 Tax=Dokdonia sp. Dokd-P16 TaxID=2173169 RepID=UPI000D54888F|nr:prephenate dehydrogenase [Dokdonia sp. Dokd-P16]AWH74394.1 prephenate dehydrogenase [Dokdonia sp. Dokd-P16]